MAGAEGRSKGDLLGLSGVAGGEEMFGWGSLGARPLIAGFTVIFKRTCMNMMRWQNVSCGELGLIDIREMGERRTSKRPNERFLLVLPQCLVLLGEFQK